MPTFFQALDKKTTAKPKTKQNNKLFRFSSQFFVVFNHLTVV